MASDPRRDSLPRKIIVCHFGHENDVVCTENIFEFFAAHSIDHEFMDLGVARTEDELLALAMEKPIALLGFNSQLDHSWVANEPLISTAVRHDMTVVQWLLDHPSGRWPEFGYSNPDTSRFLLHSEYARSYFEKFCCPGARTATSGSVGPNRHSRAAADGLEAFLQRPIDCLIALGLQRLGKTAAQIEAEIAMLAAPLTHIVRDAASAARFDLDGPLELHLAAALNAAGIDLDNTRFSQCFRLVNDSVQYLRRAQIIRTAGRFNVTIQSDASAVTLIGDGPATFRKDVRTMDTLVSMPNCRAILSVCPVNDSIHDRSCNALNAGCLPILEDNRAHRELFTHRENALLFRYDDDSLAECLALACGSPWWIFPLAERARAMRDGPPFRFGSFRNILELARVEASGSLSSFSSIAHGNEAFGEEPATRPE
jgi:hypothetical protein